MAVILAANLAIGVLDLQYIHLCMVLCKRYRSLFDTLKDTDPCSKPYKRAREHLQDAEQDHGAHHPALQDLPGRGTKSSDAAGRPGTR